MLSFLFYTFSRHGVQCTTINFLQFGLSEIVNANFRAGGPLPIELGGHGPPPQFLEKINEFLKFTIDF